MIFVLGVWKIVAICGVSRLIHSPPHVPHILFGNLQGLPPARIGLSFGAIRIQEGGRLFSVAASNSAL